MEKSCIIKDSDNPEWTEEDFEKAKTYKELFRNDPPQVPEEKEKD